MPWNRGQKNKNKRTKKTKWYEIFKEVKKGIHLCWHYVFFSSSYLQFLAWQLSEFSLNYDIFTYVWTGTVSKHIIYPMKAPSPGRLLYFSASQTTTSLQGFWNQISVILILLYISCLSNLWPVFFYWKLENIIFWKKN